MATVEPRMLWKIRQWLKAKPTGLAAIFEERNFEGLPYRIYNPPNPRAALFVYLHGAGGAGTDNCTQLLRGSGFVLQRLLDCQDTACILAPQCAASEAWWNPGESPSRPASLLLRLIDQLCQDETVDQTRLILLGVSMGGHGVWDLGWRDPHAWAGLVPVCGGVPTARLKELVHTPIWCFHGGLDTDVPVEGSRRAVQAIREAGGDIRYTEMEGVGHSCTKEVFGSSDLMEWLRGRSG